ncbi:MAG: FxsA family protein [Streptosporangiales bacterium]|nr:FxsA family protein [Streptosporangiales bacterium]
MRRLLLALGAAGVVVLEVAVLVQVAQLIGWWTLLLLIATSVLGGWLMKRAGVRTLAALRDAMQSGEALDRKLADGGVVLAGGLLMVLPGFVTDVLGALLALPVTRPLATRVFLGVLGRRLADLERAVPPGMGGFGPSTDGQYSQEPGPVVQGKVVSRDETGEDGG